MRSRHLPAFVSRQVVAAERYFLDLRPVANGPLTVVCGGLERVQADYEVVREDFPYCCLEFVAAGHGTRSLRDRDVSLSPGRLLRR